MELTTKKEQVAALLKKGILLSPEFVEQVDSSLIKPNNDLLILNKDSNKLLSKKEKDVNWKEIEKIRVMYEKGKAALPSVEDIAPVREEAQLKDVQIISSFKGTETKKNGCFILCWLFQHALQAY